MGLHNKTYLSLMNKYIQFKKHSCANLCEIMSSSSIFIKFPMCVIVIIDMFVLPESYYTIEQISSC